MSERTSSPIARRTRRATSAHVPNRRLEDQRRKRRRVKQRSSTSQPSRSPRQGERITDHFQPIQMEAAIEALQNQLQELTARLDRRDEEQEDSDSDTDFDSALAFDPTTVANKLDSDIKNNIIKQKLKPGTAEEIDFLADIGSLYTKFTRQQKTKYKKRIRLLHYGIHNNWRAAAIDRAEIENEGLGLKPLSSRAADAKPSKRRRGGSKRGGRGGAATRGGK